MSRVDPHSSRQGRRTQKGARADAAASKRRKMMRTDRVSRRSRERQPLERIVWAADREI